MDSNNPLREELRTHTSLELISAPEQILDPAEVRRVILHQHAKIRGLLASIEAKAIALLAGPVPNLAEREATRGLALLLCSVMESHIELENRILVGALTHIDAWGPVRAEQLRTEHAEQLQFLHTHVRTLENEAFSDAELALTASRLVELIRADMAHEEASILNAELLCDDGAAACDVETG